MKNELYQPYRGTRDLYPKDYAKQQYMFDVWRKVCLRFGFEEYLAPLVEKRALYTAKQASGEEVSQKELYWFTDQGDREIAIRPEMTPSVSRMIGARIQSLPKPQRWFSIANFMRYERPQKGRIREFWQLNADTFGVSSVEADAEIVELSIEIMREFGADHSMFKIYINNREWFLWWLTTIVGVSENIQAITRIIDNIKKSSDRENEEKLHEVGLLKDQIEKIMGLNGKVLSYFEDYMSKSKGLSDLKALYDKIVDKGLGEYVKVDFSLVRGFDYYTGNVFEQYDLSGENSRSMFGGGRYDKLVGLYAGVDVPAVGFAPGDVPMGLFLDSWNLIPNLSVGPQALVTVFNERTIQYAQKAVDTLRGHEIRTEMYLFDGENVGDQITYASKKAIPFVIIAGPDEMTKQVVMLKNMVTGTQKAVTFIDLPKEVLKG